VSSTYPRRGAFAPEEKENVSPATGTTIPSSSSSKSKTKSADVRVKSAKSTASSSLSIQPGLSAASHNILPSKSPRKKIGLDFASPSGAAAASAKKRSVSGPAVLTRSGDKVRQEARDAEIAARMNEAQVNSRAKDLTVLPLADLSEAFEVAPKLDQMENNPIAVESAGVAAPNTSVTGRRKRSSGEASTAPPQRSPTPSPVKRRRMLLRSDGPASLAPSEF